MCREGRCILALYTQGVKPPTFSYFFLLFGFSPTFSYFEEKFLLFEIFRKIYLLIYVGISGDSMVPMLHTAVLPLGVN